MKSLISQFESVRNALHVEVSGDFKLILSSSSQERRAIKMSTTDERALKSRKKFRYEHFQIFN